MSTFYISKMVIVGIFIMILSYFFSRAIYAQFCTTLTIPFKEIDDIRIYDISVKNIPKLHIIIISLLPSVSGSIALTSQSDPGFIKLISFLICTLFYLIGVSIFSYRLFKKTVASLGLKWPPE